MDEPNEIDHKHLVRSAHLQRIPPVRKPAYFYMQHKSNGLYLCTTPTNQLKFKELQQGDSSFHLLITTYFAVDDDPHSSSYTKVLYVNTVQLPSQQKQSLFMCLRKDTNTVGVTESDGLHIKKNQIIDENDLIVILSQRMPGSSYLFYTAGTGNKRFMAYDKDTKRLFLKEYNVPMSDLAFDPKLCFDLKPVGRRQLVAGLQRPCIGNPVNNSRDFSKPGNHVVGEDIGSSPVRQSKKGEFR